MAAKIIVVEDEAPLVELLKYNLQSEGYDVVHAADGEEAELLLAEQSYDLAILDWMIPKISGIELCRRLRNRTETQNLPIILLTARGEEADRVRGLTTGADDYVTKPFSVQELMARIKALLRRAAPERMSDILVSGEIVMDRGAHKVTRGAREVRLGPTEYRMLEVFMESPRRVLSRNQLLDRVWGQSSEVDERTVDVHIGRLRKSLIRGNESDPIRTVRGAGYVFDGREAEAPV
ncbi:response regulator in two-component regulatory system with PhoR (or CreC), regulation of Pi uptake (OmpR family) [Hyphomicrobium sp. GJ21]|jgi:two-component system phosphate regulon response regulator PhoB|uniref:phosphate regulon transcriptional regulator PhoB n=1 Tax=Hyphomicrobium sp. GJ21 TaxID=113574 RepID=UPI000622BA4C|nr:phosphate regulon transcriptional regulator PhoB [Hyphomicrobium sp. GJ21]MBN9289916.1 phosphate regulon transcriptional regulator PhoB [Hyphomicrobium denitrificans]MBN9354153.1 phosphate regulon transcriptional regulator PhoB [Hyphomicrobium denitrificans]CEJ87086.1 response regulator in two-component regulatory system with PhoR (or CreC), regulation of Pi uptake (OmpR family) [Hyphomicrobium sp. GJ21]